EREMDKTDIPGTFNAGATLGPVNETNMARIWNKHKQSNTPLKRKVFVGLSGGVDSSVAAALLKEQGYDVVGVFIKVWQADFLPCTWREERRDAMRAAAHLGIPFLTLDLEKEYKKEVVDYMIREYGAGRVPNPDVMCNKHVKFGAFLEFAKKEGADFIATGHYARVASVAEGRRLNADQRRKNINSQLNATRYTLRAGVDKEKDQSYFLWTLTQKQLAHTIFPVGHLQKSEVRALARKFGLPNAEKKDSQGLCFMGKIDMAEFLKHYLKTKSGDVLNPNGEIIGTHDGAMLYTIGQRHGFSVIKSSAQEKPYFVVTKDVERNMITVSHRNTDSSAGRRTEVVLKGVNTLSEKLQSDTPQSCLARIRYRGELIKAKWKNIGNAEKKEAQAVFEVPQEGIAAGQSLVAYDGEECLGGGVIE
ncbi:MAG: tRNA 2-thiouridine(34) synthase MnmA, partial [bacterium]|nr:tRNA 2-thiouridine(34) synthase MnmA [bacterium]